MSEINKLEAQLDKANEIFNRYKQLLSKEPDNFSHQLSIKTTEKHISELQSQLKHEKEIREKEVIELVLKGAEAEGGSIPLSTLGEISKCLYSALTTAAQRIKSGKEPVGRIPKDTIKTLNLRLAGLASGSTKLYITGDIAPDIFGYSLIEESLKNTFELLNSETPDEIIDSVSTIGSRSTSNINKFLRQLSVSELEAEISWSSPNETDYKWNGNTERVLSISNTLSNIRVQKPEMLSVTGELIMISLKNRFEILGDDGITYRGKYPSGLVGEAKKLNIGNQLKSTIEKEIVINETTGKEKSYYTLVSLSVT